MRAKRSSTNISTALAAVTRPFRLLRCGQLPRSKRSHSNVLGTATLVLLTLLAFSLTPPSPSYAATLTVCASGCYTTIAAAIAAANPLGGDTISIQDASHNEANITVDRDLTIQGQGATNTAVDGTGISGSVFTISAGVTATIQDVTIRNGSAFLGGGIYNNGTVTISNGTLSGNSAGVGGGGIYNVGTVTISNSTLSGNSAPGGGSLANFNAASVKNSIVGNSSGGNCYGTITASGANLDTDGSCRSISFTTVTPAQLNLGPLALNPPGTTATQALLPGSAAINAATNCTDVSGNSVTTDQRGVARPDNGESACDIGAFELVDRTLLASFSAKLSLQFNQGAINLNSAFTLGAGSDGIFPLTEAVGAVSSASRDLFHHDPRRIVQTKKQWVIYVRGNHQRRVHVGENHTAGRQ